jgi:hypothetical protein
MAITWVGDSNWFSSAAPVLFPVFGQEIRVMAYTAAQPGALTPAHVVAVEALLALPPERRADWSAAVFADCERAFKTGQAEPADQTVRARCRTPEDVWSLVRWKEVVVPDQGPKADRFILVHGRPEWRVEHGLQLLLKNEQLLWVGRADEPLFMDSDWARDYKPRRRR